MTSLKGDQAGLKGDLAGGVSAGVLTIPVSMGYGILALQPLGDGYVSHGVIAGLLSAIVVLLVGALLGGSAGLMYTPRSVVTLIMAAVIFEGVVRGPAAVAAHGDVQRTLTLVFFIVVAAGIFQALFGALRLGGLFSPDRRRRGGSTERRIVRGHPVCLYDLKA